MYKIYVIIVCVISVLLNSIRVRQSLYTTANTRLLIHDILNRLCGGKINQDYASLACVTWDADTSCPHSGHRLSVKGEIINLRN